MTKIFYHIGGSYLRRKDISYKSQIIVHYQRYIPIEVRWHDENREVSHFLRPMPTLRLLRPCKLSGSFFTIS